MKKGAKLQLAKKDGNGIGHTTVALQSKFRLRKIGYIRLNGTSLPTTKFIM